MNIKENTLRKSDLDTTSDNLVKLVKSPVDKSVDHVYINNYGITGFNNTEAQIMAISKEVLENIRTICRTTWGDDNVYEGPSGKYKWEVGRDTGNGIINGVVRKMVAEDKDGNEIYTVAGSFKINDNGEVARWTGLPRRFQKEASEMAKTINGVNGDH